MCGYKNHATQQFQSELSTGMIGCGNIRNILPSDTNWNNWLCGYKNYVTYQFQSGLPTGIIGYTDSGANETTDSNQDYKLE